MLQYRPQKKQKRAGLVRQRSGRLLLTECCVAYARRVYQGRVHLSEHATVWTRLMRARVPYRAEFEMQNGLMSLVRTLILRSIEHGVNITKRATWRDIIAQPPSVTS